MRELADFAGALARGEMNRRLLSGQKGEIGVLTYSLNTMADSLSTLLHDSEKDQLPSCWRSSPA